MDAASADRDQAPPPGNAEAKRLLLTMLSVCAWMLLLLFVERLAAAIVPSALAIPFILPPILFLSIRLATKGAARVHWLLGAVGLIYIVGGAVFDMASTVIHTPDLELESNPLARALLDSGMKLSFVYAYAIVCQTLFLASLCVLWFSLLKHRDTLRAAMDRRSALHFFKSATGGAQLTWRQWMLPLKLSELPRAYPLFFFAVATVLCAVSDRWFLGFSWQGWAPHGLRFYSVGVCLLVGLGVYLAWLWTSPNRNVSSATEGTP